MTSSLSGSEALLVVMERAIAGDQRSIEEFYRLFLELDFFVPERQQNFPMSNAPEYPSDFVTVLGLQAGDRTIVPVFSNAQFVKDWSGQELQYKKLNSTQLLERTPEGWWITLNPGRSVEKELSPWELELLRGGTVNIPELLADALAETGPVGLTVQQTLPDELPRLKEALCSFAETEPAIDSLFLMKEIREGEEEQTLILIGFETLPETPEEMRHALRERLERAAQPALIGSFSFRVIGAEKKDEMLMGAFRQTEAIYTRQKRSGFLSTILGKFR